MNPATRPDQTFGFKIVTLGHRNPPAGHVRATLRHAARDSYPLWNRKTGRFPAFPKGQPLGRPEYLTSRIYAVVMPKAHDAIGLALFCLKCNQIADHRGAASCRG